MVTLQADAFEGITQARATTNASGVQPAMPALHGATRTARWSTRIHATHAMPDCMHACHQQLDLLTASNIFLNLTTTHTKHSPSTHTDNIVVTCFGGDRDAQCYGPPASTECAQHTADSERRRIPVRQNKLLVFYESVKPMLRGRSRDQEKVMSMSTHLVTTAALAT